MHNSENRAVGEIMVLTELFAYTFGTVAAIFTALDTPQVNLDGHSLLDLFIVVLLIDIVLDFFLSIIDFDYNPDNEEED